MVKINENNNAIILGEITSAPVLNHRLFGEKYYSMNLKVKRLSDTVDTIPVTFSERLMKFSEDPNDMIGKTIEILGQFRSHNKRLEGENKSRLELTLFAREIFSVETDSKHENKITLKGFVCKTPVYRKTPLGRDIADVLLAVNRPYNKTDYIPCVCWARNATYAKDLKIGEEIVLQGRIQSRPYKKKCEDGTVEERIAYEVSASTVCSVKDLEEENEEKKDEILPETNEE